MRRCGWVLLALAMGCQGYRPGSLTATPLGSLHHIGCLDVAVDPEADAAARGPVVKLTFANRCDNAVPVDLAAIRASGLLASGERVAMRLFDPEGVVRPGLLDARRMGSETLEYHAPGATPTTDLCLDLGAVTRVRDSGRSTTCMVTGGFRGEVRQ